MTIEEARRTIPSGEEHAAKMSDSDLLWKITTTYMHIRHRMWTKFPVDAEHTHDWWEKNARAHLRILINERDRRGLDDYGTERNKEIDRLLMMSRAKLN